MFVHNSESIVKLALLTIIFSVGVVYCETTNNNNNDISLSENDLQNSPVIKQNPEQVEFMNLSPANIIGRDGKLFEVDSTGILQDYPLEKSLSFIRPYSKFSSFFRNIHPITPNSNVQFIGDNVMSEARARRYAYPKGQSSQSFLRFGRAYDSTILTEKRPIKAKDTAFLRFGRSQL